MSEALKQMTEEELIQLFRDKGLTVTIWGCGCCSSPHLLVTTESRIFDEADVVFDMHNQPTGGKDE